MSFVLRFFCVLLLVLCLVGLLVVYSILLYFICFVFLFQFLFSFLMRNFTIIGIMHAYTIIFFNILFFY